VVIEHLVGNGDIGIEVIAGVSAGIAAVAFLR
jgi:precorrin-4 methylase